MFRSHGSWFERQFHVLNTVYVNTWRTCRKLLKAKNRFWRQFHVFKPFYWPPGSPGGPRQFAPLGFEAENGSQIYPKTARNGIKQWTYFWFICLLILGSILMLFSDKIGVQSQIVVWMVFRRPWDRILEASPCSLGPVFEGLKAILAQHYSRFGSFSKTKVFVMRSLLCHREMASWIILGGFGIQNGSQN